MKPTACIEPGRPPCPPLPPVVVGMFAPRRHPVQESKRARQWPPEPQQFPLGAVSVEFCSAAPPDGRDVVASAPTPCFVMCAWLELADSWENSWADDGITSS